MIQIIIKELSSVILSCAMGVYAYRYMNLMHRIIFFQIFSYLAIYIISFAITLRQQYYMLPLNNQWIYNVSMPIEAGLLTWAGYEYFKSFKESFLLWIGYAVFLLLFVSEIIIKGPLIFSNHGYIAESMLLLVIYLIILYTQFREENTSLKRLPDLWIALGIIIYFGGIVPYLSLIHYLDLHHPIVSNYLYSIITVGLANLRYIFVAIGFWMIRRNALIKTTFTNE